MLGSAGRVHIGSNVFIGMNSTILKGVNIGCNVIIGANSLISKDIPDNCVVVGNPAKVIMTIEEYYLKRKQAQLDEAKELVNEYRIVYEKDPNEEELSEFFWLFTNGTSNLPSCWEKKMHLVGNYEISKKKLAQNKKKFNDIYEFIETVNERR